MRIRHTVEYLRSNRWLNRLGRALATYRDSAAEGAAALDGGGVRRILDRVEAGKGTLWQTLRQGGEGGVVVALAEQHLSADASAFDAPGFSRSVREAAERGEATAAEAGVFPELLTLAVLFRTLDAFDRRTQDGSAQPDRAAALAYATRAFDTIDGLDRAGLVARAMPYERVLDADPSGVYPKMTADSQQAYREALERLARRNGCAAVAMAEQLLEECRAQPGDGDGGHIGHRLEGLGGAIPNLKARVATDVIVSSALTVLLLALPLAYLPALHGGIGIALFACLALIANDAAESIMAGAAHLAVRRRWLASLRPDACEGVATAVAIPSVLIDRTHLERVATRMEQNFRACGAADVVVIAAFDFEDSAAAEPDAHAQALLGYAVDLVAGLNERHGRKAAPAFVVTWRSRVWCQTQRCWMGKERKRGILEEVFRFVAHGDGELHFADADVAVVRGAKYVVMIDDDNLLLPGSLQRLVGAMEHPLNRVRIGSDGRVRSGFGVLAPECFETNDPIEQVEVSGEGDITFNWYGCCLFPGKGIVRPAEACSLLTGKLPAERVLSHDTLEGFRLRTGIVSGAGLMERPPSTYLKLCQRIHRWTRGNWQNVPVLAGARGAHRFGCFDWLAMSKLWKNTLVPLVLTAFFSLSVIYGQKVGNWFAVGLILWFLPPVVNIVMRGTLAVIGGESIVQQARYAAGYLGFCMTLLLNSPHRAAIVADAVVRTAWRILARRRLLEWRTASKVEAARFRWSLPSVYLMLIAPLSLALLWWHWQASPKSMLALAVLGMWLLSPAIVWAQERRSSATTRNI